MSDFDPCECVWNHQHAMQRLMNLLRNSQDTCSDTDCITNLPDPMAPYGGYSTMMLIMLGWLVVATALYLFRPRSLRGNGEKPHNAGSGSPPPPTPPVH